MLKIVRYCFVFISVGLLGVSCGGKGNVKRGQVVLSQNGKVVKQIFAITQNGEKVILFNDGTWQFADNTQPNDNTSNLPPEDVVAKGVVFELLEKSHKGIFEGGNESIEDITKKFNIYKFRIRNPTRHDIKALKPSITITNVFDEEYYTFQSEIVERIPAGGSIEWVVRTEAKPFDKAHQAVFNKRTKEVKAKVQIKKVLVY